jgi:hypothetical protein
MVLLSLEANEATEGLLTVSLPVTVSRFILALMLRRYWQCFSKYLLQFPLVLSPLSFREYQRHSRTLLASCGIGDLEERDRGSDVEKIQGSRGERD